MRIRFAAIILLMFCAASQADDKVANVQQALKDQGFYYGEITGEINADTTAAIRRFQIRNGLQITGELNDETRRSLQAAPTPAPPATAVAPAPAPAATAPPRASVPDTSDLRNAPVQPEDEAPPPRSPWGASPQIQQGAPLPPAGAAREARGGSFAGTPFENAPIEVQRGVITDAQRVLARRGLYRGEINGMFGPDLEFSLRAYQSRVGLTTTGRLDLGTLAALQMLPGANAPVYTPRRNLRPRPRGEPPPVRGEWIRP